MCYIAVTHLTIAVIKQFFGYVHSYRATFAKKGFTLQFLGVRKIKKMQQRFQYQSILSQPFVQYLVWFLKSYLYIQQRYGNADVQILATLKIKIWIYRFSVMPMLDLGEILILRVPMWFLTCLFCIYMAPPDLKISKYWKYIHIVWVCFEFDHNKSKKPIVLCSIISVLWEYWTLKL